MKLSESPTIHPTARVNDSMLGRYTEVGANCHVNHSTMGDYSYCVENTQIAYATIGKFSNIAASVRLNATNHPVDRPTLHHFTYRASDYFDDAEHEADFFAARRSKRVRIGHDTWLGHGSTVLPFEAASRCIGLP